MPAHLWGIVETVRQVGQPPVFVSGPHEHYQYTPSYFYHFNTDRPVPLSTETVPSSTFKTILHWSTSSEWHCRYRLSRSWEKVISPLGPIRPASCRLFRILPTTSTYLWSPSPSDTSRGPHHYRLQSFRVTRFPKGAVPFDSSNSEVVWEDCCRILRTSYRFLPQAVPSPCCLSFSSHATTSWRDTLLDSPVIPRIRLVRVPPPVFLNHLTR